MKGFNSTGMGNLPPGDKRAYVHLAGVYVLTFFIIFLAFKYFKQFTRFRQRYKKLALLNNFSCIVTNVPLAKGITTSAKLQSFFEKLYPNQVASATLIFNLKPLERKIKDRQSFIEALDRSIHQFQNSGIRPLISLKSVADSVTQRDRELFGLPMAPSANVALDVGNDLDLEAASRSPGTTSRHSRSNSVEMEGLSPTERRRREIDRELMESSSERSVSRDSEGAVPLEEGEEVEGGMDAIDRRRTLKSPNRMVNCWGLFRSCRNRQHDSDYMVDAMLWYQRQIDELDEEIELERRKVEESEDLQEAVPLVLSSSDGLQTSSDAGNKHKRHDSHPSSHPSSGLASRDELENPDDPHASDSTITPLKVPAQLGHVLWRLSKKLQPDREQDDEILNEPLEPSDIPREADPSLANLSDHERRILATTSSLLVPAPVALQGDAALELNPADPSTYPDGAANVNNAHSSIPTTSDAVLPYTPTMEAAKARRLTRSLSRSFNHIPMRSSGGGGSSITQTGLPSHDSVSPPVGSSGGNTMSITSVSTTPMPRLNSRNNSGSLTHLPVISSVDRRETRGSPPRREIKVTSSSSYEEFGVGRKSGSSELKSSNGGGQESEDEDDGEEEEEEERLIDRLMIRVPGVEWLRKMWRNWVIGAPELVTGEDGLLRQSVYRPTTTGFVTFKTIAAANHCANSGYLSKSFFKWRVDFAPAESDVLWRNIRLGWWQQGIRYIIMIAIVCVLIIFWGVPVGFISQWANLEHLESWSWSRKLILWLKGLAGEESTSNAPTASPMSPMDPSSLSPTSTIPTTMPAASPGSSGSASMGLVESLIARLSPTVTLLIFMNLLVPVIRLLFDYVERPSTKSGQETKVFRVYYAFLLFNVLFLSTLTSQISNIINQVIRNPSNTITDLAKQLGETLPSYGAFFINYILNATFLSGALGLPRLIFFGLHFIFLRRAKSPQEIERVKRESVGGFEFDYQYAAHLNIFTIALAYSSMVPLILPTALLYFALWFVIDKYNLLFAFTDVSSFDRSGVWTPLVFRRVFAAVAIYHFTMFGTFLVKQNYVASGLLLPLLILDLVIHWYAINTFTLRSQFVPLDEATRYPHTAYQLGLEDGYLHPAMHDIPDSLYSTRYDANSLGAYGGNGGPGNGHGGAYGGSGSQAPRAPTPTMPSGQQYGSAQSSAQGALRFHPSLTKDETGLSSSTASAANRKRIARSLEDELGLEMQEPRQL